MALARIVPKLGPYPELRSFKCRDCGEVETLTVAIREKVE
jgi:hypothetical protein